MAKGLEVRKEGGPSDFRGRRIPRVGPFEGSTLQAQILALLHAFGHALDTLPTDENDVDGKSVLNTEEVLRFCGPDIKAVARKSQYGGS